MAWGFMEVGPHFRVQVRQVDQGSRSSAAGGDDLKAWRFGRQSAHHILFIEESQIEQGIQLIKDNH